MDSLQRVAPAGAQPDQSVGALPTRNGNISLHNISRDLLANFADFAISTLQDYQNFILICKGSCFGERGDKIRDKVFRGHLLSRTIARNPALLDLALRADLPRSHQGLRAIHPCVQTHASTINAFEFIPLPERFILTKVRAKLFTHVQSMRFAPGVAVVCVLGDVLPKVTALSFANCPSFPPNLGELSQVKVLDLSGTQVKDEDVDGWDGLKLRELNLAACPKIKNHVFDRLNREELEVIDLSGNAQLQTHVLTTFEHNLPKKLRVARLAGIDMRGYPIDRVFSKLPQLEELNIYGNPKCRARDNNGDHLDALVKIKTLTTLNIGGSCQMVTSSDDVRRLGAELPNLKELVVPDDHCSAVCELAELFQNLSILNGKSFKKPSSREESKRG